MSLLETASTVLFCVGWHRVGSTKRGWVKRSCLWNGCWCQLTSLQRPSPSTNWAWALHGPLRGKSIMGGRWLVVGAKLLWHQIALAWTHWTCGSAHQCLICWKKPLGALGQLSWAQHCGETWAWSHPMHFCMPWTSPSYTTSTYAAAGNFMWKKTSLDCSL